MMDKCYYTEDGNEYRYPAMGDKFPPSGYTVQLITKGGRCVEGTWPAVDAIGWAPFPKRNKAIEMLIKD